MNLLRLVVISLGLLVGGCVGGLIAGHIIESQPTVTIEHDHNIQIKPPATPSTEWPGSRPVGWGE